MPLTENPQPIQPAAVDGLPGALSLPSRNSESCPGHARGCSEPARCCSGHTRVHPVHEGVQQHAKV